MNTLNGYSKSTLTDKYVLTAAGGHLAVGNASGNIPLSNGTVNVNLNADLLDGTHKSGLLTALSSNTTSKVSLTVGGTTKNITTLYASYLCSVGTVAPQTGRTQAYGNVYSYHTNTTAYTGAPTTYTATIGFGKGTAGTVEICGEWTSGRGLWVRALRDVTDNWYAWDRILTEATYSKVLDNRYYTETEINTKLGDYVTLATAQNITGAKRFNKQLTIYTSASNQTPKIVFDEYYNPSWVSEIVSDYYGTNVCTTEGFTHGLFIVLGRGNPFDNLNILDSTKTPIARISKDKGHYFNGAMQVTGNVTAPTFIGNLSGNATSATSATKVYVNQHTNNDNEYPLVWSNQTNTNNALENQLYKSYANLLYNPKYNRITASTFKGELFGNFAKRFSFGGGQNNGKYYYVGSITLTNAWQGYHSIWSFTGHERAWSGLLYVGFRLSNTTTAFSGVQVEWLSLTDPTLANSIKMTYEDTESSRVVRIYILLQNYISSSTAFITNSSSSISLSGTVVDSYSGTLYTSSVGPISTSVSADRSITIVPHNNNEINFGGSNTSTTVYIGYRKIDTKPIPTSFVFGNNGAATLTGSGFIKNGSNDNYALMGGGGHKQINNVQNTAFYKRVVTVNGSGWDMAGTVNSAAFTIYAPTTVGTSGQLLKSNGSGAPTWVNQNTITSGYTNYLKIHDVRGTNHLPNSSTYPEKYITAWFNNTGTPDSSWWSGITVKGWTSDYSAWQLCSYSSTGTANNYGLYVRNGVSSGWGSWRRIIDSGNIANQSVNYASSAGSVAWGNVTGKPTEFNPTSHTHSYITSGGRLTCGTTTARATGLRLYEIYNNGYPFTYGNVIQFNGASGVGQIACQWHGTGLAYRSAPDTSTTFTGWATILTSTNSSVSGGGSSWGSSITVKINSSTATLTIPSAPSIGNGKITIKQNGTEIGSFTMNQSSAGTINLTDTTYSLVGANGTTGLIKNGSTVTSASGYIACPIINGVPYYQNTTLGNSGVTAGTYTPTPSTVTNATHQSIKVPELAINAQGLITKASLKNVPITGSFYITSNKTLANSDLSFITSIAIAPGYTVTFPTPSASNEGKIIFVKAAYGNSARYVSGKIAACNSICSTASTTTIDIGYYSRIFVCMDYGSGYAWVDYYCG